MGCFEGSDGPYESQLRCWSDNGAPPSPATESCTRWAEFECESTRKERAVNPERFLLDTDGWVLV